MFVEGSPYLFTIDADGSVLTYADFVARGSGQHIASSILYRRHCNQRLSVQEVKYIAYEAKTLSESEPTVGYATRMLVMSKPDSAAPAQFLTQNESDELEIQFVNFGPQDLTANMVPIWRIILDDKQAEIEQLKRERQMAPSSEKQEPEDAP